MRSRSVFFFKVELRKSQADRGRDSRLSASLKRLIILFQLADNYLVYKLSENRERKRQSELPEIQNGISRLFVFIQLTVHNLRIFNFNDAKYRKEENPHISEARASKHLALLLE